MAVLSWINQISQPIACPVCGNSGNNHVILNISNYADHTGENWEPVDLISCSNCETKFYDPPISIPHENLGLVKFYVEQDAGINGMLELFLMIDSRPIEKYMEIGGGFGFSLDYAKRILGWNVTGYDPSAIAERGKELLGVPICNRYFDETAAELGAIDLILSSEVIEHIADPVAHIRLVRLALKPDGLLLLTTPNAGSIKPGMAPELMPILSPGQHLVLFTATGLRKLLTDNGFPYLRIIEKGDQIRVAASMVPFSGESAYYSRDLYWQYLDSSAALHGNNAALFVGFLGRLYKEFVHAGQFDRAKPLYDKLRNHISDQYHFDIEQPKPLDFPAAGTVTLAGFGEKWPFNLCAIWYCRGMFLQLFERDLPRAVEMFDAACRFGHAVRETLQSFGADDGETAHLCREAELGMVGALAQCDPTAAVAALDMIAANRFRLDLVMLAAHLALARRRLFGDLINLGHFAAATQVMSASAFLSTDELPGGVTSMFAYGLHLLNSGADPTFASAVFAKVQSEAITNPDRTVARFGLQAEIERLAALARFDSAAAITAFNKVATNRLGLNAADLDAHSTAARDRLLADLVNLGHLDHALQIMTPEHCLPAGAASPAHLAAAHAYGLYLLNAGHDPAGASTVFAAISAAATLGDGEMRSLGAEAALVRLAAFARFDAAKAVAVFEEAAANRLGLDAADLNVHIAAARNRLLTDLVNLGHIGHALRIMTPAHCLPTAAAPAHLAAARAYGLHLLNDCDDPAGASTVFAAIDAAAVHGDNEMRRLGREAEIERLATLARFDPPDAILAFREVAANRFSLDPAAELNDQIAEARDRLLADLVNLGHLDHALRIMTPDHCLPAGVPSPAHLAAARAYGLHLLNDCADPAGASAVFAAIGAAAAYGDGEMQRLGREAEIERLATLARFDPLKAVTTFAEAAANPLGLDPVELEIHIAAARDRLLADLVNLGHLDHAMRIMTREQCLPSTPTPVHLAAARAYGLHLLNDGLDPAGASTVFTAISVAAAHGDRGMRPLGREAELERLAALARFDPAKAIAALDEAATNRLGLDQAEFDTHISTMRRRLLTDLVNLGHLELAANLAPIPDDRADWQTLNCLALIELLHREQPATAAALFEQAFSRARSNQPGASPAEAAGIKHHEMLSHLVAGDAVAAITAARMLIGPVAEEWIPIETRQATEALLKEHAAVLAQILEA